MLESIITYVLFFGLPLLALGFWIACMCLYFPAKKREKNEPGSVDSGKLKKYKVMMIVSSVIAGVLLVIVGGFIALIFMAVAFM